MILYSKNHDKIHCVKCTPPQFNSRHSYVDHIMGQIDDTKVKFWFSVRNNGSNFYFAYDNQWYRTAIVTNSGFDLYVWMHDKGEKLLTLVDNHKIGKQGKYPSGR